jgi:hypothetical protein
MQLLHFIIHNGRFNAILKVKVSSSKQEDLLINILSVVDEMETHYLNICYTNIFLQSLIK